ncbi:MAG: hypothetical protein AAFY16_00825 [Cyanobacteria bacterium J06642_3]
MNEIGGRSAFRGTHAGQRLRAIRRLNDDWQSEALCPFVETTPVQTTKHIKKG